MKNEMTIEAAVIELNRLKTEERMEIDRERLTAAIDVLKEQKIMGQYLTTSSFMIGRRRVHIKSFSALTKSVTTASKSYGKQQNKVL